MAFLLRPRVVDQNATHYSQIEILAAQPPRTTNRDGMTRIGFAYNQKPESTVGLVSASDVRVARRRRASLPQHRRRVRRVGLRRDDRRRRVRALARYGDVIRLEATRRLPASASAPSARTSSSTSPKDCTARIARPTCPRSASSSAFRTPAATPSRSSLCLDKARTKEILAAHGIPNAPFVVVESIDDLDALLSNANPRFPLPSSRFPLFVKPVHEGSSKGITERNFVRTRDELEAQARFLLETYEQPVIVEAFLPGAEFTCGVLGNGASARVLPIVGMNFGSLPDGRAADLRLRSEVDLGRAERIRSTSSSARRASTRALRSRDRRRRAPRLSRARLPRLVAHRRPPRRGRRAEHRRGESAAGHSSQSGRTTPACPRPRARPVSTTTSSSRPRCSHAARAL